MAEVEAPAAAVAAATPEVATATEGGAATEAKGPHKLHRQWTFWYDIQTKTKSGAAWGTSLKKAYTFDTVEEFWRYVGDAPDTFMARFPFLITPVLIWSGCRGGFWVVGTSLCACFWPFMWRRELSIQ